jgi:hypothetical protein
VSGHRVKSGSKSFNRTFIVIFNPTEPDPSRLLAEVSSAAAPSPPPQQRRAPFFHAAAPPLLSRAASSSAVRAASPPHTHSLAPAAAQPSLATEFASDRRTLRPNPNGRNVFNFLWPFSGKGLSHEFDSAR